MKAKRYATPEEAIEALCELVEEIADSSSPNDCFCKKGGFWRSPDYANNPARYENSGEAIRRIIASARYCLDVPIEILDKAADAAKAKRGAAEVAF